MAPVTEADSAPVGWRLKDLVLAELVAVTLLMALAVAVWGAGALPWTTAAERDGKAFRDSAAAAESAVLAFLDVDYRDIDARSRKVINLSTGAFGDQYSLGATDLRIATMRAQSVSKGTIRAVAVQDVDGSTARVLVGADAVLRSTSTAVEKASATCPHAGARCNRYRYLVTLEKVDDRWLMSGLAEVP